MKPGTLLTARWNGGCGAPGYRNDPKESYKLSIDDLYHPSGRNVTEEVSNPGYIKAGDVVMFLQYGKGGKNSMQVLYKDKILWTHSGYLVRLSKQRMKTYGK